MADESGKKSNFVTRLIDTGAAFIAATNAFRAMTNEYNQLEYRAEIVDEDLIGDNAHLSASDISAVFDAMTELIAEVDKLERLKSLYQLLP